MSIEKVIEMAVETKSFVNTISSSNVSWDDLMMLSEVVPSIQTDLTIIRDWVDGNEICFEDTKETTSKPTTPRVVNTETKTPRIVTDKTTVIEIAEYILAECEGLKTIEALEKAAKMFHDINQQALKRIIYKYTFSDITDKFFVVKNHIIKAVRYEELTVDEVDVPDYIVNKKEINTVVDSILKKGSVSKAYIDEFFNIWSNIEKSNGDITPHLEGKSVSYETCLKYVNIKQAMIAKGIYTGIDDTSMAVMISDGVKKYGKKRTNRISNYVVKHYGVKNIPSEHFNKFLFGVMNKQKFVSISDKFFK